MGRQSLKVQNLLLNPIHVSETDADLVTACEENTPLRLVSGIPGAYVRPSTFESSCTGLQCVLHVTADRRC